jgi:spermidine synthase
MPDTDHVQPYVYEAPGTKALHFSISEIQSRMQTSNPDALDLDYTRTMMGFLLFDSAPAMLAMIGLGGGSMAKFCFRHLPATNITAVEINPHVIALRELFQIPPDQARFQVQQADGADFVRDAAQRFDVLLVDGFDSEGQPPALCSQGFYADCSAALTAGGLMVTNLHPGYSGHITNLTRIQQSFQEEILVVSDNKCGNSIIFASNQPLTPKFKASAMLRKPAEFDRDTWETIKPALAAVASAFKQQSL